MAGPVTIRLAVEGPLDEAVARKLIAAVGAKPGPAYGKEGKPALLKRLIGYNHAAKHYPWLVLIDLDHDADCAPLIRNTWLPLPAPWLCFRIVVRAVEAWLLADTQAIAAYLGISAKKIPPNPEGLPNPKSEMVNLARSSKKRSLRQDMIPRDGSGRPVGAAYTSRLLEYVQDYWRPKEAAVRSDSLQRTLGCLKRLVERYAHEGT